jgi:ABC-type nitrate/sulfonate/bicarbonate transport system substrate-binding protein
VSSVRLKLFGALLALMLLAAACATADEDTAAEPADPPQDVADDPEPDDDAPEDDAVEHLGTVRVAYFAVAPFLPMYLAAERYAEQVGITVEMTALPTGPEILTGVATGQYDVGGTGIGAYAYNAHVDGLPFEFVSYQHMDHTEVYWVFSHTVAGSQEEAEELAQELSPLVGETFGTVTPGGSTTYMLELMLQRGGLSFDDVEVDFMPFPDMIPALESGAVVATTLAEPLATIAIEQGVAFRGFPDESDWTDPLPMTAIAFNTDWSEANPELAEAYLRAFQMAVEELETEGWKRQEDLEIAHQYTDVPAEVLAQGYESIMPVDLAVDFDLMREFQQFFLDTDTLTYTELIDDEELWNMEWREQVLQAR